MKYYLENVENVLKELETSKEGLNNEQIIYKRTYYGLNKLEETKRDGILESSTE